MALSIIDKSNKVPGTYIEVLLGVGARSAGDEARQILITGNKTSTGTAVVSKIVLVPSIDDARTLFGAGSFLFQLAKAVFAVCPGATLYAGVVATSDGVATSATQTFIGPATAAGSVSATILGET